MPRRGRVLSGLLLCHATENPRETRREATPRCISVASNTRARGGSVAAASRGTGVRFRGPRGGARGSGPTPISVHTSEVSCARDEGRGTSETGGRRESDARIEEGHSSADSGGTMHRQRPASTGQHRATIVAPGGSADSGGTTNRQRPASTGQHRATIVAPGGSTRANDETHRPGRERHERERHGRGRRRGEREPGCDAAPR